MNISIKREQNNARISSAEREKFGAKLKTKTIFKALAMTMLMPAMLLTTACSNEDDFVNNGDNKKGYPLQVTVNVTREGDATTRATYTESTGKLAFSAGDKLLVRGNDNSVGGAGSFAGMLDYVSEGTFSGTITTQNSYSGTADELFTAATANWVGATLFPNGYETYEFLSISGSGYNTSYSMSYNKAIAATKAAAVEQFSLETAKTYSSGFALSPQNAILNFTITGLTDGAKDVTLKYKSGSTTKTMFTGSVTPTSGTAAFALGARLDDPVNLKNVTLTIGGTDIAIISTHKYLEAGKIYNINRAAAPAPAATSLSGLKTAINGGTDCSSYIGWEVNSEGAIAESGISGTKIGYVAYVSTSDVDADVSGSRILVIASADASATALTWGSDGTYRHLEDVENATDLKGYSNTNTLQGYGSEAHPAAYAAWNYSATIPSGGASPAHWFMPTKKQWENMRDAKGGTYSAMATAYGIDGQYWTSNEYFNGTDYSECNNYAWNFVTNSTIMSLRKLFDIKVRSIFAY